VATGGSAADKPLTGAQHLAFGYGTRMQQANNIIVGLEESGFSPSKLQGALPNFFKSQSQQQFEQAQRNFINATLRRESGAAIAESEFESAEKQYFPQPGDKQETLEQKAENRDLIISNMLKEAGQQTGEQDVESFRTQLRGGEILVRELSTGNIMAIQPPEFIPGKYEAL
jgi:ATP-dependent helicase YprA (DUF1998 family)